jgi:phosphoesterase RecJ-like protein
LIAAHLLECGTKSDAIYNKIYNQNSLTKIHIRGLAMASMETFLDGQLTFIFITKEMFQRANCTNEDTEEITQIGLSLKSSKVAIMIREYSELAELRVSLRSKDTINIQSVAVKFGGGGHLNAAGCRLENMSIENAKQILLEEIKKIL